LALSFLALTNDLLPQKTYTFYFGKCQRYCIALLKASTNATGIAITRIKKRGVATCFQIMLAIRAFLLVTKATTIQLYVCTIGFYRNKLNRVCTVVFKDIYL
jgi:hypothetical protein